MNDKDVKNEPLTDMKMLWFFMLWFLAGELGNAATYFTTFASVNRNDAMDIKKYFGNNKTTGWKPFTYESRVKIANKVEKFKEKNLGRNAKTQYIASL